MNRQEWCMKNGDGVEKKGVIPKSRSRKVGHVLTMKPRRCWEMKKHALGDKVRVQRIIEAEKRWDHEARHTKRKWVSKEQKLDGIVIGHRHVQEGVVDRWSDHIAFIPKKYIECYLVAYDLHRKPVHVLPEDMEVLGDA